MNNNPKIKILVGYHKPAELLKSEIFEPIHLGRDLACEFSKDETINKDDYQWMLDNMIGDNTGENISSENRFFNECTAFYWAWKNYDKLGNPDYIGFMHYRRHLCFDIDNKEEVSKSGLLYSKSLDNAYLEKYKINDSQISEIVSNNDVVVAQKTDLNILGTKTPYNHYKNAETKLHIEDLDFVIDTLKTKYPQYTESINKYLNSNHAYFANIFIVKKEIFFEYCNMLFDVLFSCKKLIDPDKYNFQEIRVLAYISEWLWGIFLTYKKQDENLKVCELKKTFIINDNPQRELKPQFKNEIPVVFSSDDGYAPYLGVCIKSLIENSSKENNYTIYILDGGISENSKRKLTMLETDNVKIRYIDITPYLTDENTKLFYLHDYISSPATYYRFFIPQIFSNFEKLIYCDCDAIFLGDVKELFDTNLENNILAAAKDTEVARQLFLNKDKYYSETLNLKNPYNYFQAGMLVMNIPEMKKFDFTKKCLDTLEKIKTPRYVDQCILNIVCEGRVKFFEGYWNVENHVKMLKPNLKNELPCNIYVEYENNLKQAKFLHYTSAIKPWIQPETYNSDYFWKYARMTPFYEEIIYKNTKTIIPPHIPAAKEKFYKNFLQRIFSVKNLRTHNKIYKVITILGIKIKTKIKKVNSCSYNNFFEKIFSVKNQYTNGNKYKLITIFGLKIKFNIAKCFAKLSLFVFEFLQKFCKKDSYILFDNLYEKNAENIDTFCIFNYMQKNNIKSYYVLWRENPLYQKLKQENKLKNIIVLNKSIIDGGINNFEFFRVLFFKLLFTKMVITSFGNLNNLISKFLFKNKFITYVCTGHGPTFLKTSIWENEYLSPQIYNNFLCSNKLEQEIFKQYGFPEQNLPIIGLPRWDLLKREPHKQKTIFVMFTWRNSFGTWEENFTTPLKETKYYKNIQALITNERLNKLLTENNIKIIYSLHHSMQNQIKDAKSAHFSNIEYVPSENISKYISSSDLFITDYSSLFFDFAYLNIPIVFYRPDFDDETLNYLDKCDLKNVKSKDKYLFNCCYDIESTVDNIEKYINNNFELEKENIEKLELLFENKHNITQKLIEYLERY